MKFEAPEFKRCCCFLPLRYGIIAWGYMYLGALLLFMISFSIVIHIHRTNQSRNLYSEEWAELSIYLIICIVELLLTSLFLVGAHMKNAKLMRIYYINAIVVLCISMALLLFSIGEATYHVASYPIPDDQDAFVSISNYFMLMGFLTISFAGAQIYFILLVRSEINKLNSDGGYRFTNTANEAQGVLEMGVNALDLENVNPTNDTDTPINTSSPQKNAHQETMYEIY